MCSEVSRVFRSALEAWRSCPYVEGGRDPETGLDCYGLPLALFPLVGVEGAPDLREVFAKTGSVSATLASATEVLLPVVEIPRPIPGAPSIRDGKKLAVRRFVRDSRPGDLLIYADRDGLSHLAVVVDRYVVAEMDEGLGLLMHEGLEVVEASKRKVRCVRYAGFAR